MGRGGGKKKGEFSVYDQNIIDETQWETMLTREVKTNSNFYSLTSHMCSCVLFITTKILCWR